MAPIGRKFLRARLRCRSECKDRANAACEEIEVWVCQEEKLVSGVSKHTTCADVVEALLEDHKTAKENQGSLQGEPKEYCLLERWNGFERALPPRTRILGLWEAWGVERPFVQFVLVNASESAIQSSKRTSKPKGALLKWKKWEQGPAQYVKSLPMDRQNRMMKKAFRKLEKIRKEKTLIRNWDDEGIHGMVQLIIAKDRTIQQQIIRMRELDLEIEQIERELSTSLDQDCSGNITDSFDGYFQKYYLSGESMEQLDTLLRSHNDLIKRLSLEINSEMKSRCVPGTEEPQGAAAYVAFEAGGDDFDSVEVEKLRMDSRMHHDLYSYVQFTELEKELNQNEGLLSYKSQECEDLTTQLSYLCTTDSSAYTVSDGLSCKNRSCMVQCKPSQILSQRDTADTDSDTGISSTHSQDSLAPYEDITSPLDTDV